MSENKTLQQLNEDLSQLRLAFLGLREFLVDELASLHVETDVIYRASLEASTGYRYTNQMPDSEKNRLTNLRAHLQSLKVSYVDELRQKIRHSELK
jgi:hypothetical protein